MKAPCELSCKCSERSLNTSPSSGRSPPHVWRVYVQEKLLPTVTTGWKLWIPAHAINFGFVPPSQRVLYVNIIAVSPIPVALPVNACISCPSARVISLQRVYVGPSFARLEEKLPQECSRSDIDLIASQCGKL